MSLLTYEDARPYAKDILDEVGQGHMPPWHAERRPVRSKTNAACPMPRKDAARLGRQRRAERGRQGSAARAAIHRRVGDRTARPRARNAGDVHVAGRRHGSVSVLLHADGFHRGEIRTDDRSEAGQPRGRAPHPGQLRGEAGSHADAGAAHEPGMAEDAGPGLRRACAQTRERRADTADRHVRARHPSADLPPRHGASPGARRRDRVADALHGDRQSRGDRSHADRDRVLERSDAARSVRPRSTTARSVLPPDRRTPRCRAK